MTLPKHPENAASLDVWKQRMSTQRTVQQQTVVLVDMLEAHMAQGSYEANPFGRCAQLIRSVRDPLYAVALLRESMRSTERRGDPVRWALGRLKFQRAREPEVMSAAQYLAARGEA